MLDRSGQRRLSLGEFPVFPGMKVMKHRREFPARGLRRRGHAAIAAHRMRLGVARFRQVTERSDNASCDGGSKRSYGVSCFRLGDCDVSDMSKLRSFFRWHCRIFDRAIKLSDGIRRPL